MQAQSILPPPTRFFVIIPRDIRDRLVPKKSEAFGLYTQLADAVTCEVPHGDKKFGLVLGGKSMSQVEWAKRFRMTRRSFQRALAVLKSENLVVVHRGQHDTRIAVTDSVKKMRRVTIEHYPWLLGLPDAPNMAQLNTESDAPEMAQQGANMAQLGANMAQLGANMAQLDDGKNAQVLDNALSCSEGDVREYRVEEKVEEREARPKSSPPSLEPKSTPTPTEIDEICAQLYLIGKNRHSCHSTFSGKQRAEIGGLLATYSRQELCEAYAAFVEHGDEFEMRHAPRRFIDGGLATVIVPIRAKKLKREKLVTKWRESEIERRPAKLAWEVVEREEREAGEEYNRWASTHSKQDTFVPSNPAAYERHELAELVPMSGVNDYHARKAKLFDLRGEASNSPAVQSAVQARLAEPFDPGPPPSDYILESHFSV